MDVLVINAGSSTYKCSLFQKESLDQKSPVEPLWKARVEWGQEPGKVRIVEQGKDHFSSDPPDKVLIQTLSNFGSVEAIGHRVVHGGDRFIKPCLIDHEVKKQLKEVSELAPLHNPQNLKGIEISETLFPKAKQVAVFDTAFHATMPEYAVVYPIPYRYYTKKIRRYGFHGINHQYCARRAESLMQKKNQNVITCHLGNGASLAAIKAGKSIDTTMGLTPLEGLMMGTRTGDVDPGILLHMLKTEKMSLEDLEELLWYRSGLLGICSSNDMRDVIGKCQKGDAKAELAFRMYVHSVQKHIGAMAASLNGMDGLVFSGGIGENSSEIRQAICEGLAFLGIEIDREKNFSAIPDQGIAKRNSKPILVIHAREDWEIARQAQTILSS